MNTGQASWKLPYPIESHVGHYQAIDWRRYKKDPWRRFLNLCRMLKRTKVSYEVVYIDMGQHCRALVTWNAARKKAA